MPGTKHTAINGLSQRPKAEEEYKNEEEIDNSINSQLNIVRISVLENVFLLEAFLEPEYIPEHQQITYYLLIMQRSLEIVSSKF